MDLIETITLLVLGASILLECVRVDRLARRIGRLERKDCTCD
ncbi:hypothetical protein [Streptomyces sp. SID8499]|nr:hypothetical protein [Streptomyces sp. SID8499]